MILSRRTVLTAACLGTAGIAFGATAQAPRRPNIVLCMADDQGWGDMAYNGHPKLKTPHFDAMAAEAIRFDHFYAAAPVCSPTRASVLTGRHPNRMGCFTWGNTLRPQEVTIAEALKAAGYATGHFGKWHIGSVQEGSPVNPGNSGFDTWVSAHNFYDNDPILSHEGIAKQHEGESSMVTVDAAIDFMREHSDDADPFLAVVWFGSPHNPHRAIEEDRAIYDDEPTKFQDFYGEITGMDRAFGKLRNEIDALGIRENTVLWYCSDNGGLPKLGATGGRGDKGDIYEGGLRVPAMIEWPARLAPKQVIDAPCSTVDIFPTVLEMANASPLSNAPLDGISLMPHLSGNTEKRGTPLGFWKYPADGYSTASAALMKELMEAQTEGRTVAHPERLFSDADEIHPLPASGHFTGHAAWLEWPWKLHRIQKGSEDPRFELYQLNTDPMESKNLADVESQRVATMSTALEAWMTSVVASHDGADY